MKPLKADSAAKVRFLADGEEASLRAALDAREERLCQGRDRANAWRRERGYPEYPGLRALPFSDYLKPLVILCLNTGLRRGELFGLAWEDVDLDRSMVTIAGTGAKSGKTRHVPLNPDALDVLRGWRAQSEGRESYAAGW